ncbi:MAG: cation transporter [bacterium]|nr:cation transporter [bacterium]
MKEQINKKILRLSYFTVIYNIIEGVVSIFFGSSLNTISLVGFGFDSFIESISGSVVIWKTKKGATNSHDDPIEAKAIKLISFSFFILAGYVLYESVQKLLTYEVPHQSWLGVAIASISIVVMLGLYYQKKRIGLTTHNRALVADSKQTLACVWLSITLLIGLGLNYLFGLWWTDAVAGIIIAGLLFKEGYFTYKEKHLCGCS